MGIAKHDNGGGESNMYAEQQIFSIGKAMIMNTSVFKYCVHKNKEFNDNYDEEVNNNGNKDEEVNDDGNKDEEVDYDGNKDK